MTILFKDTYAPISKRCDCYADDDEDQSNAIKLKLEAFSESNRVLFNRYFCARHYFDTIKSLQAMTREAFPSIGIYENEKADMFVEDMFKELKKLEESELSLRQFLASPHSNSAQWLGARLKKHVTADLDFEDDRQDRLCYIESAITKVNKHFITYLWNTLEQIPDVPYFKNINASKMVQMVNHTSGYDLTLPLEDKDYVTVATNIVRQFRVIARLIALTLYEHRTRNRTQLEQVLREDTLLYHVVHNTKLTGTGFEVVTCLHLKYTNTRNDEGPLISTNGSSDEEFLFPYTTHASFSAMRLYCNILSNDLDITTASREIEIALVSFFAEYLFSTMAFYQMDFEHELATLFHPEVLAVADIMRRNLINIAKPPKELAYYRDMHEAEVKSEKARQEVARIVAAGGTPPARGWSEDPSEQSKLKSFALTALNVITFPLQVFGMVAGFCLSIALGIFNACVAIASIVLVIPIFIIHTILKFIFGPRR